MPSDFLCHTTIGSSNREQPLNYPTSTSVHKPNTACAAAQKNLTGSQGLSCHVNMNTRPFWATNSTVHVAFDGKPETATCATSSTGDLGP